MPVNLIRIIQPSLVIPGDVTAIDLDALYQQGIRGFIFDLDNTLMPPHTGCVTDPVTEWLTHLKPMGFQSVILTNNKKLDYCQEAGKTLDMPVIYHAAKPSLSKFQEALALLQLPAGQVAVVGDRPLTDIWGGQKLGAYTILVDPLTKTTEAPIIKLLRSLERSFIRHPKV